MDYGILSIIPPLVALLLAFITKEVYISLFTGILSGYLIMAGWNPGVGFLNFLEGLVEVFQSTGNTRTIMFCILVGALIKLIDKNGGIDGFMYWFKNNVLHDDNENNQKKIEWYAFLVGALIFIETSISVLTVGTMFRPLFDKYKIAREKLAYIADSCSAPVCILIPFNAWGAYILGLMATQGIDKPIEVFGASMLYNFYPFLALGILIFTIFIGEDIGPMRDAKPYPYQENNQESKDQHGRNMTIPLITMIILVPTMLIYTGWDEVSTGFGTRNHIVQALTSGSGSFSVLVAVAVAVIVAIIMGLIDRKFSLAQGVEISIEGMSELLPLGIIMMLAFSINIVCNSLGTGQYIASVTQGSMPYFLLPALLFIVSSVIAFSTGTSWGTFAIMVGIGIPIAQELGLPIPLFLAAVLGGGIFGDHCSPISDTTVIASTAAGCSHIEHVRTQIPYALTAGVISVILYIIVGLIV